MSHSQGSGHGQQTVTVTIITTSGTTNVSQPGSATVRSAVQKAFAELDITTPLNKFTLKGENDQPISANDHLSDICPKGHCRIFVDPPKVENA